LPIDAHFLFGVVSGYIKSVGGVEIFTGVVDIGNVKGWFWADSSGPKSLKFNSEIDIFNYLHAQDWTFVSLIENSQTMILCV
jgi:hypothetical protein